MRLPAQPPGGLCVLRPPARRNAAPRGPTQGLRVGSDRDKTLVLRRYILGLSLTALTYSPSGYLRQGCNLVRDPELPLEFSVVGNDGSRAEAKVTHSDALEYAKLAAEAFGVGEDRKVEFDKVRAKADVSDAGDKKPKAAKGAK